MIFIFYIYCFLNFFFFFFFSSRRRHTRLTCDWSSDVCSSDLYAETLIAQRISMVEGVSQVQVYGAMKYAVRVQMDPQALADRGIGVDQVAAAIANGNPNTPTGSLYGKYTNLTLQTNGQLMNAAEFRPLIVAYRNGAPVRLEL